MERAKFAVFVSGTGSNLRALVQRQETDLQWPAAIAAVVSNKPECQGVAFAVSKGLPVFARSPKEYATKADFEQAVLEFLTQQGIEYIALAGYMRLVGSVLLDAFPNHIFNIHPSLLPAFPGKQAVQDAFDAGVEDTGVTVHYVDAGMDTGPIVAQVPVQVDKSKGIEELYRRIHSVEHQLYGDVIGRVVERDRAEHS